MGNQAKWLMMVLAGVVAGVVLDRLVQRVVSPPAVLAPGPARQKPASLPDSIPGDGAQTAPAEYPIKGNERSGIYHVPGGFAYDRTIATTYFRSEDAAERAGLRHAKA